MDVLIKLFKYFCAFVPLEVLRDVFVRPASSEVGYEEVSEEILEFESDRRISEIYKFVFSSDSVFVSDKLKNSDQYFLFIEYGTSDELMQVSQPTTQRIAITVAKNISSSNTDNLNQVIVSNTCKNILLSMLETIYSDSESGCGELCLDAVLPYELNPVDPKDFFGNLGWCAFLDLKL